MGEASMGDAFAEARALLREGVLDVFGERGFRLVDAPAGASDARGPVVGRALAFDGGELRGLIALSAARRVWESLAAPELAPMSHALLEDMIGELCNIVLGRLQRRLLPRGVYIGSGTPMREQDCALPPGHRGTTRTSEDVFDGAAGAISVRFDLRYRDGLSIGLAAEAERRGTAAEHVDTDQFWF